MKHLNPDIHKVEFAGNQNSPSSYVEQSLAFIKNAFLKKYYNKSGDKTMPGQQLKKELVLLELIKEKIENTQSLDGDQLEELSTQLQELSQLIEAIKTKSETEKITGKEKFVPDPKDIANLYQSQIFTKMDWENFKNKFELVYPGFISNLKYRFPHLTDAETRLVLLSKMGLNTSEMAVMINVAPDSVKKTRQRLRKKIATTGLSLEELLLTK